MIGGDLVGKVKVGKDVDCRDDAEAAHLGACAAEEEAEGSTVIPTYPYGALLVTIGWARSRYSGRRHGVLSPGETCGAACHLDRHLCTYGALGVEQCAIDIEDACLHVVRVADRSAEEDGRDALRLDELDADRSSGQGLGRGDGVPALEKDNSWLHD